MPCRAKEAGAVYRSRQPQESPFYRLVERFFPEFEAVYEERYQERYGFWRAIIGTVVRKFLECGDLKHGFARVRCPKCREELFVPLTCRSYYTSFGFSDMASLAPSSAWTVSGF